MRRVLARRNLRLPRNLRGISTLPLHLFFNDTYRVPLPGTHRFPMEKYRMTRERTEKVHYLTIETSEMCVQTVTRRWDGRHCFRGSWLPLPRAPWCPLRMYRRITP